MRARALAPLAAALLFATACTALLPRPALAQAHETVRAEAAAQRAPYLETLRALVAIESGSDDREGLERIARQVADRLAALGAQVRLVEPAAGAAPAPAPLVEATLRGNGTGKVLLLAHMDTVYRRGMLERQPFRVDGNKAYGLAISDDKQGVALAIHTVALLQALGARDYGTLTVLVNGDEEVGSPGSRARIAQLGAEHDATLSFEATRVARDKLSLATSGIATITLKVHGKASHAGSSPELGINALYELAHQILQTRDLSDPATGVKMNWTNARAGSGSHNVIPEYAEALADVRVIHVEDYDRIEKQVRERITHQLVPQARVEMAFTRGRPPLVAKPAARALALRAQEIYREIGRELAVDVQPQGGGTDAAYAALETPNAVIEHFGVQGFGAHSGKDEYILIDSIEPRLYLASRLILEIAKDKVR